MAVFKIRSLKLKLFRYIRIPNNPLEDSPSDTTTGEIDHDQLPRIRAQKPGRRHRVSPQDPVRAN